MICCESSGHLQAEREAKSRVDEILVQRSAANTGQTRTIGVIEAPEGTTVAPETVEGAGVVTSPVRYRRSSNGRTAPFVVA